MLLTRLAFWLALPLPLTGCSGVIVPKLFPGHFKERNEQSGSGSGRRRVGRTHAKRVALMMNGFGGCGTRYPPPQRTRDSRTDRGVCSAEVKQRPGNNLPGTWVRGISSIASRLEAVSNPEVAMKLLSTFTALLAAVVLFVSVPAVAQEKGKTAAAELTADSQKALAALVAQGPLAKSLQWFAP